MNRGCLTNVFIYYFLAVSQQPNSGPGRLTVGVSRSHTSGKTPLNK